MKEKRSFFKNGIVWAIILVIAGIAITASGSTAGVIIAIVGMFVFAITVIKMLHRLLHSHKKEKGKRPATDTKIAIIDASEADITDRDVIYSSVPRNYRGGRVAYEYPDVQFNCPEECLKLARSVPENYRAHLMVDHKNRKDEHSIALYYHDECFGYLRNNRIKEMVYDFGEDLNRSFLILGGAPGGDQPVLKIVFYYLPEDEDDEEEIDEEFDDE